MARDTRLPGFDCQCPKQELDAEGARHRGTPFGSVGWHGGGSVVASDGKQSRCMEEHGTEAKAAAWR
jgi:hypothetical protein